MTLRRFLGVLAFLVAVAPAPAGATELPPGFDQQVLAEGLTQPVQAAWAPDGRIFVAEKPGRIRVVQDGVLRAAPLLDIRDRVNEALDRGLLGLAVDPDFAHNGRLYYVYVLDVVPDDLDTNAPMVARVERVTVAPDNTVSAPTVVLGSDVRAPCPRTADDCLSIDNLSHGIGTVRVGDDATVWIGLGDSASYTIVDDLAFRAQEETSLNGKILHVDADGHGLPDHPFCPGETDLTKACTKVYAKGFRNPFRFALRDGVPIVGDVGWLTREEVDRVTPGSNNGWPCYEGDTQTVSYSATSRCLGLYGAGGVTPPLWSYARTEESAAVIGGPSLPADGGPYGTDFGGTLFVGDYAQGWIKRVALQPDGSCTTTPCTITPFATGWYGGTDLALTPDGTLAWTDFGTGGADGRVIEAVAGGPNRRPVVRAQHEVLPGDEGRTYRFTTTGTLDPDDDAMEFSWDFGDRMTGAGAVVDHTYAPDVTRATVRLTITDGNGGQAGTSIVLAPGDAAPEPQIVTPADGGEYVDGSPQTLEGSAADREDGALSGASLRWRIILRHGTHIHVLAERTGATATFTPSVDHDADSHYEITLTATDSAGNERATPTVLVHPRTVRLTLASDPAGAPLSLGERAVTAPAVRDAAVGFRATLTAAQDFRTDGASNTFLSWSDGGAAQHDIVIPDHDLTLTASYATHRDPTTPPPASTPRTAKVPTSRCPGVGGFVITVGPKGTRRLTAVRALAGSRRIPYRAVDGRRVWVDLRRLSSTARSVRIRARAVDRRGRGRTVSVERRLASCRRR